MISGGVNDDVRRLQETFDKLVECFAEVIAATGEFKVICKAKQSGRTFCLVSITSKRLESLSRRQQQVARLAGEGRPVKLIAGELKLSSPCVAKHLRRVYEKLGIDSRAGLGRLTIGLATEELDSPRRV